MSLIFFSYGSNRQYLIIGLDNDLLLDRTQAIIWTNDGQIHWRIYVALAEDEVKEKKNYHA